MFLWVRPFVPLSPGLAPALEGGVSRNEADDTLPVQELAELLASTLNLGRTTFFPNLF